ncbi:Cathepsin K [Manis pentadactyla]|nr:Cathepsin K [Manis pentadactyla]
MDAHFIKWHSTHGKEYDRPKKVKESLGSMVIEERVMQYSKWHLFSQKEAKGGIIRATMARDFLLSCRIQRHFSPLPAALF